ncbi:ACT domain-containing protein, partial [Photobacterium sanctipauli]
MAGITDLATLLTNMSPVLMDGEFVFCTQELKGDTSEVLAAAVALKPLATFVEPEGLTLVLAKAVADQHG